MIDVEAGGLNPVDLLDADGRLGREPATPYVVGREGVGRTADGERVYFERAVRPFGSAAERTLVARDDLVRLGDDVDVDTAIALGTAGTAAWLALVDAARLEGGQSVIVLGSGGVVGQVAVQAALILGAARVAAVTRDPAGAALELGADVEVTLGDGESFADALRGDGGGAYDVVVDMLWGRPAVAALGALRPGGTLVQVGSSFGASADIPAPAIRRSQLSIVGHANPACAPGRRRVAFRQLLEHARGGRLRVRTERLPLGEVASAWERQRNGPGRKLVLIP